MDTTPSGDLASLTDANSHSTQNIFDVFSDITGKTLPDGSLQESRTYDASGNLTSSPTQRQDDHLRLRCSEPPHTRTPDPTLVTEPVVSYTYTSTGKHASTTVTTNTAPPSPPTPMTCWIASPPRSHRRAR